MSRIYILLFLPLAVFLASCVNSASIYGKWEACNRIIEFDVDGSFSIEFKNPAVIKSFCGKVLRKKNIVVLLFEEFEKSDGEWLYTDGTDLENYKEIMFVSFEEGKLITKIKATGKTFVYSRVSE